MNIQAKEPRLLTEFEVEKVLGSGSYGVVLQAVRQEDQKPYAIKVVAGNIESALKEVENLVKIPPHPNVVHYYTFWQDTFSISHLVAIKKILNLTNADETFKVPIGVQKLKVLCIQMELCGEDLRCWIGKQNAVDEKRVNNLFLQLAKGLEHIHKQNLIHRDLKPDNVFLGKADPTQVKIGDLGIATDHLVTLTAGHTRRMGTPLYLAPEQASSKYGRPAEIYSLGLILYEMLNPKLQPTFNRGSYDSLFQAFIDLKYKNVLPDNFNAKYPKISELILKMIKIAPEERPGFPEIFKTLNPREMNNNVNPKPLIKENPFKNFLENDAKPEINEKKVEDPKNLPQDISKINQKFGGKPIADQGLKKVEALNKPLHEIKPKAKIEIKPQAGPSVKKMVVPKVPLQDMKKKDEMKPEMKTSDEKMFEHQGSSMDVCPGCRKNIEGGKVSVAMGKKWHSEHFKCNYCLSVLTTYFEKDGNPFCPDDYHKLYSPKCAHCNKPILKMIVQAMGKTWHKDHFTCAKCEKPLEGTSFCTRDGKPYCQSDFVDLFAEKCAGCKKAIVEGKITTSEHPKASWHPNCFICFECKQPLQKYYTTGGHFYCHMHRHNPS